MKKVRRLRGVAALSAAALATIAVAGPVAADECLRCEPTTGVANAFLKLTDKDFPGATDVTFRKIELPSYSKLEDKAFPGATEFMFQKADLGD